jgi:hypothetical protein
MDTPLAFGAPSWAFKGEAWKIRRAMKNKAANRFIDSSPQCCGRYTTHSAGGIEKVNFQVVLEIAGHCS